MRRLQEQEKVRGRPKIYADPVRVSVMLERNDWERLAEMCRDIGVPVAGRLRDLIREAVSRESTEVAKGV